MAAITHTSSGTTTRPVEEANNRPPPLHSIPGEIRNLVYDNYFASLPPPETPLIRAYEYRPDTGLCFVDKGVCSETLSYLAPISAAWNDCTWTVDLDPLFRATTPGVRDGELGEAYLQSILANLSDADAAHIRTIEFSTSAFALPATPGVNTLSKPFVFRVDMLSTHRLLLSTPLTEEEWQSHSGLIIDSRVEALLYALHFSLSVKRWVEKRLRGQGRRAWTVRVLGKILTEIHRIVSQIPVMPVRMVSWAEAWLHLDEEGVWDGRLPGGQKMMLKDMWLYMEELDAGWMAELWLEA